MPHSFELVALTTLELGIVAAAVVGIAVAVGALWFAREAVREMDVLRREARIARLSDLIADFGEYALKADESDPLFEIKRERVVSALAQIDRVLLACKTVASGDSFFQKHAAELTARALDELARVRVVKPSRRSWFGDPVYARKSDPGNDDPQT